VRAWYVIWPDETASLVCASSKLAAAALLDEIGNALDPDVRWLPARWGFFASVAYCDALAGGESWRLDGQGIDESSAMILCEELPVTYAERGPSAAPLPHPN
jgi:hypothetical protein